MPQTGATRHQKFLKSEKSKTKLKSKKKDLPKGTNVTKTNFKVKKIVIKEQLTKHGKNEALSTKKLNLKELLSRLNHFNTNSRTEALGGLKELILTHVDVLNQNLGQLILNVTPLVLNVEKVVRHESFKVMHLVLSNVSMEKVEPFFDIMSTYLRSAMTHIDSRIQEDSLLFLDLLLVCTPEKVAQDFHRILPNFLDMISKLRVDLKPGRTLSVNLGSQITSVKWRVKVLHRLKDYLNKYIQHNDVNNDKPMGKSTHFFDDTKMNHYSLFNPTYSSVCRLSCFSAKNSQDIALLDEAEKFKQYVSTLMPLLFETWLEACPKKSSEINIETMINEDAASLLKHTLEVISLLFNLVQYQQKRNPSSDIEHSFVLKYKQSFSQHFVSAFPYVTNFRTKQKKIADLPFEDIVTDPKLVEQNLKICHLFVKLNPNINLKDQAREITGVLNYVEKTFICNATNENCCVIINILDTIFSKKNNWTKTSTVMESVFQRIIKEYFNENIEKTLKQRIFSILCKIALNDWLSHFHSSEAFEAWLTNLPNILLEQSVTTQTINMLHIFAVRNNETFNNVTKPNLSKIIQNLPKIEVSDCINSDAYYKLFSLLYWIKIWDEQSLNMLEKQLINNEYKKDHGKYIFDTLRLVGGIL